MIFHATFVFPLINGGTYILPTDNNGISNFVLIFDDIVFDDIVLYQMGANNVTYMLYMLYLVKISPLHDGRQV